MVKMVTYDFKGRLTAVTGGASGIGEAVCEAFAKNSSDVAVMDINEIAGRNLAQNLSEKYNVKVNFYKCNVADYKEVQETGSKILKEYGRIDNLVTAAGYGSKVAITDLGIDEWKKTVDINLNGTFYTIKAFVNKMLEQKKGNIILIGTGAVVTGSGGGIHYASTKVAQYGIVKALSYELLPAGIRSNIITPHIIDTPMLRKRYPDTPQMNAKLAARVPIGRIGLPADIANVALFLASDEAGYICGADIVADGGGLFYLNPSASREG
jgi:3-oxoacyl-[acyl-carrier protein] reductase